MEKKQLGDLEFLIAAIERGMSEYHPLLPIEEGLQNRSSKVAYAARQARDSAAYDESAWSEWGDDRGWIDRSL